MEKRKSISLSFFFARTLLLALLSAIFIFLLIWGILNSLFTTGFIYPANAGETMAKNFSEELKKSPASFEAIDTKQYLPFNFIEFNSDNEVMQSNLSKKEQQKALETYSDKKQSYQTASYVVLDNGNYWLLTWQYKVTYSNSRLNRILPSPEILLIVVFILLMGLLFFLFVHYMSKRLKKSLTVVSSSTTQITNQELDIPLNNHTGLKEFDVVISSMDVMRDELKTSLTAQWHSEQQRREDIASLAHDIKTPLTIIGGNTELLLEESLTKSQNDLATSIYNASVQTKNYVKLLQQMSIIDMQQNEKESVSINLLINNVFDSLLPLAKSKHIRLEKNITSVTDDIYVYQATFIRALINLGENAINHSLHSSRVSFNVKEDNNNLIFSVDDSGDGFSEEALRHAKEAFWQSDKSRSSNEHFGLGLPMVEKVAKKYNGELLLCNTEKGGQVSLVLPKQPLQTR